MFKHQSNVAFAATTIDPSGTGLHHLPAAGPAVATVATAGSRKRGRDIRGLDRFRQVIFGENGFPRLHAMAARNPTLMYPPEGIPEARQRVAMRQQQQPQADKGPGELDRTGRSTGENGNGGRTVSGPRDRPLEADDEALWAMFDERRQAELDEGVEDGSLGNHGSDPADGPQPAATLGSAAPGEGQSPHWPDGHSPAADEQLANYHHKQLEVFLRMLYEFNHATLVKLPMQDTLSLLARCGKEAVAHVLEREVQLRMAREGKLRELKELRDMREKLRKRTEQVRADSEERALAEAERRQAMLDEQELHGYCHEGDGEGEGRDMS